MFSRARGSAASLDAVGNPEQHRYRAQHHDHENDLRGVHRQDQLAQSEQHARALAGYGHRNGRADT